MSSENGEEYILFAHKMLKEGFEEVTYSLISLQEFLEKGNDMQTYAYKFSRKEEIMGYMVSNAEYTKENIYGLIVDVLCEVSFFGFEQEHLAEETDMYK